MDKIMINYACDIWAIHGMDIMLFFDIGPMVALSLLALVSPLDQNPL